MQKNARVHKLGGRQPRLLFVGAQIRVKTLTYPILVVSLRIALVLRTLPIATVLAPLKTLHQCN